MRNILKKSSILLFACAGLLISNVFAMDTAANSTQKPIFVQSKDVKTWCANQHKTKQECSEAVRKINQDFCNRYPQTKFCEKHFYLPKKQVKTWCANHHKTKQECSEAVKKINQDFCNLYPQTKFCVKHHKMFCNQYPTDKTCMH